MSEDLKKPQFEYKSVHIEVGAYGDFFATVNGQRVSKPSMDSIRKFIDKSLARKFEPFTALRRPGYGEDREKDLMRVNIVSVIEDRRARFSDRYRFIEGGGGQHQSSVFADTPENEKLYSQIMEFDRETERLKDMRIAARDDMWEKLVIISAKEFFEAKDEKKDGDA